MTHYVNVKFSDTIAEFLSHLLRTAFNARMKWIHWNNHWLKFINSIQIKFSVSLRILWIFNVVFSKFLHPHSDENSIQFKRTEVVSPFLFHPVDVAVQSSFQRKSFSTKWKDAIRQAFHSRVCKNSQPFSELSKCVCNHWNPLDSNIISSFVNWFAIHFFKLWCKNSCSKITRDQRATELVNERLQIAWIPYKNDE